MSEVTSERAVDGAGELKRVMGPKLLLLFIVGDILGTGVYALTGEVAGEVGGAAWAPFLVAFAVATLTAFSYLELVTKYPAAGGAATFIHKAFGIHFVTFIVAFAVMASGITSASTASRAFAGFLRDGLQASWGDSSPALLIIALGFMTVIGLINLRGVGESVKANVVLTLVELSGLLMIIFIGLYAMFQGRADFSRVVVFESPDEKGTFLAITTATALAFFAMIGFEDSVNMAEETTNPSRDFPKMMLTGLGLAAVIYTLVSVTAVALVPVGDLVGGERSALTQVVAVGAPDVPFDQIFPWIGMFAVANTALINMLMASRLVYGMAKQEVLPPVLGRVHASRRTPWVAIIFTTLVSYALITYVTLDSASEVVALLGGTTALLLLVVFVIVNAAVLVLRKDHVEHKHFIAPWGLPIVAAVTSAFLVGPWARSPEQQQQYVIAGGLLLLGIVLWAITWFINRAVYAKRTFIRDPEHIDHE
ncbi:APC family permease [Janibacter cremeus]|uniref:APC family permease n=1 Tax=Janibacter cremeus TaxID=1285192 RepID=UPI0023F61EF5|nr:APC family permease [Janibacter cremeus]WEV78961.1 APC family permease [Janibacter cremeus]